MEARQIREIIDRHENVKDKVRGLFATNRLPNTLMTGAYVLHSSLEGGHWLCIYVTDENVEFYDSLARFPEEYGLQFPLPVVMNSQQLQSDHSDVCGQMCLFILFFRTLNVNMECILNFFDDNTEENDLKVAQFVHML